MRATYQLAYFLSQHSLLFNQNYINSLKLDPDPHNVDINKWNILGLISFVSMLEK